MVKFNSMEDMIQSALNKAGYIDMEPTEANLRECFSDYVSSGIWENVHYDDGDLHEYAVKDICRNLLKLR